MEIRPPTHLAIPVPTPLPVVLCPTLHPPLPTLSLPQRPTHLNPIPTHLRVVPTLLKAVPTLHSPTPTLPSLTPTLTNTSQMIRTRYIFLGEPHSHWLTGGGGCVMIREFNRNFVFFMRK